MKRLLFLILILAVGGRAATADEQTRTVDVKNDTPICYNLDLKGWADNVQRLDIGHYRLEAGRSHRFTYKFSGVRIALYLTVDPCVRGVTGTVGRSDDAGAHTSFQIVLTRSGKHTHIRKV